MNPYSLKYDRYWSDRTVECLEGIWGDDSKTDTYTGEHVGGYRWLPGNIVFHTHHCPILKEVPGRKAKVLTNPDLRDIEWFIGYDLAACDGYSGMKDDKERTCFRPIGELQKGNKISNSDKILIERYEDDLRDKYGDYKKYVDARDYMYQTHDAPMGTPLWHNESQNYMLLSTRRLGKSYIVINGVALYKFTFNGARTLAEYWSQDSSTTCVVGSGESSKTKEFFAKWNVSYDWLRTEVGAEENESGAWWYKIAGSVAKENTFVTDKVKVSGGDGYTGPGNRLWHVSYARSASKGAGTSLDEGIIEEVGLTEGVEDIHAENTPAQKSDYKFGKSTYIGTGGDFDKIESSRKMFYKPRAFEILPCKNLFDLTGGETARFVPSYYYPNQYRDDQGNQDINLAFEDIMSERDFKESQDTLQYLRHKASYPIEPKEIFVKADGNKFPVSNLEDRREQLENGAVRTSIGRIAFSNRENTEAYWIEDLDGMPLTEMQHLTDDLFDKEGMICQYESPRPYRPKRKYNDPNPMYLLFVEPVRNDVGSSFFYAYVWKFDDFDDPSTLTHNIVCEWLGRFDNNNEKNLERVFQMAAYYDCNIFPEINNDAIKGYARRVNKFDWLIPEVHSVEGLEATNRVNHEVGFYVAPNMKPGLVKLLNEFLRKRVDHQQRIEEDQIIIEETIIADTITSQIACAQLIDYNDEGNFDVVDGLRLLPVWYKIHEGVSEQFQDLNADKELRELMRQMKSNRTSSKRRSSARAKIHARRR